MIDMVAIKIDIYMKMVPTREENKMKADGPVKT